MIPNGVELGDTRSVLIWLGIGGPLYAPAILLFARFDAQPTHDATA